MIEGIWVSPQEGLPPLDEEYGHCSEEVAIVLKSGVVSRGLRYYNGSKHWVIFNQGDIEVEDEEVSFWGDLPSLQRQ